VNIILTGIYPFVVGELISPGTENEDLGRNKNLREVNQPPNNAQIPGSETPEWG
jgi:hypothetical protein